MTDDEWLDQQITQLAQQQTQFTDRAFWLALKRVVHEQSQRKTQRQGEIDGRTWRPDRW